MDYVAHRRVLLEVLEKSMVRADSGRYIREEVIHKHIMPLGLTSDAVEFEARQNLWVVDERLAFHHWIGSDKQIRKIPVESDSQLEPDITALVYGEVHAMAEDRHPDYRSVFVVEFKRPERDDYTRSKNPIVQVTDYIANLRAGKRKDGEGRTLSGLEHVPFYCFIICTITPTLRRISADYQFDPLPHRDGFFLMHKQHKAYIEIASFDDMLRTAKQRNRVFFEKLGLPAL